MKFFSPLLSIISISDCDEGWYSIRGHCYFFGEENVSIQDARQKCQDKNSRLFEPKNGADYHAVLAVAKKVVENWSGNVFFWLGLHDKTNEGIFTHFSTDNFTLPGNFFQILPYARH